MRILYVTTVGGMMGFFKSFIYMLIKEGHTVDIACNRIEDIPELYRELGCRIYKLPCERKPLRIGNIKSVGKIKNIVSVGEYDIVHCHSPIASICTRLGCARLRKRGVRVIYTAHGFHFYKGAPLTNWLLYYPMEKLCSRFTDVLITINREDYLLAVNKMKAKRTIYVPGVGIDIAKYTALRVNKREKREEIGVPVDAIMLLSLGELNENKNHQTVIYALGQMGEKNIHYVIAGKGDLKNELLSLAKRLGISHRVHLLGYRRDVGELCKASDIYIHPSFREGLPVSLMEAMACGLPVIASDTRGCADLVKENGGMLFDPNNAEECRECIESLIDTDMEAVGWRNTASLSEYSLDRINTQMKEIYRV